VVCESELRALAVESAHRMMGVASFILLAEIGNHRLRTLQLNFEGGNQHVFRVNQWSPSQPYDLLFVRALSRRAPDQRIIHALVQAVNSFAVISLLIDFEIGPQKKLRCKLFDREPDRIRSVPKPPVSNWSSAGSLVATGEQLRLSIIIKVGRDLFGYHLFDRYLFKHDFSDLNLFIQTLATVFRIAINQTT